MTKLQRPKWKFPDCDTNAVDTLASDLNINPLTARLLINRGLSTREAANRFLKPDYDQLHDPMLLPDMELASERIAIAIESGEKIFVHGDYDVDGVTSTAVYVRTLKSLKADVEYKVPHRQTDGYDLRIAGVDRANELGATLIITSDCGILAFDAIDYASSLGIDVIVTDHHEPGDRLPNACAVVNPHRVDSKYPFPHLAGVGVAFKTMQAVVRLIKPDFEQSFLRKFVDLVACGTIADVMPLVDENRVFVWYGLKALATTNKPGLRALIKASQMDASKPITTYTIGFGLAPRVNAVGRMDDADVALQLMLTQDAALAEQLVSQLNSWNVERQTAQKQIFAQALEMVEAQGKQNSNVIVLASEGWNSGVVGIVAGKLVETFYRPAIVIALDKEKGTGKGSARSVEGFNIVEGIQQCAHLLTSCGGHEMAAGIGLSLENVEEFNRQLNLIAAKHVSAEDLVPIMRHDGIIEPSEISVELLEEWEMLAPFGEKNPEPRFASTKIGVEYAKRIGKDLSHLRLRLNLGAGQGTDCVGWGQGDWVDQLNGNSTIDLLYTPQINVWNERRNVQFELRDLRQYEDGL